MNKKVIIIASAVLAFFAGAIWVSEVPVVATLVALLEVCAGFGLGFLFCKEVTAEVAVKAQAEVKTLKSAQKAMKQEKTEVNTLVAAQKTIAQTKKNSSKSTKATK